MASSSQPKTINIRKSSPEDMKYVITQFHRPVNFLEEFSGPVYFRKRTYVDEAEEINHGPDTETARIKNARARNQAKNLRRQQREEEYQNYLKSQDEEKKPNPSNGSEDDDDENQDTKPENATASSSAQPNPNGTAKPEKKRQFKKKKNPTRVRSKRNTAYVIEDENQTKGFEGSVITPSSEYGILLLQGGEFRLIFTDSQWITFKPKQIFNDGGAEEEVTQADLDAEVAAAEKAMKEGVKREKEVAKFLVKDEDHLQQLLDDSKFKSVKSKKREEADYRYVADDDDEVQVKSELTALDVMEDDEEVDDDDEMDKKLAKGMDIASDEDEDAGAEHIKQLLKEFKDPDMLMKKAEEAAQKRLEEAAQKKLEEEKLAKEKAKRKEASPSDSKNTVAIKKEEETSKKISAPSTSAPAPKKIKREDPTPAASTSSSMSLENEVALLKTELTAFLQNNGGKASLKSIREQFIPKGAYPTKDAQKARLNVLIQVIKSVGVKEEINKEPFVLLKT